MGFASLLAGALLSSTILSYASPIPMTMEEHCAGHTMAAINGTNVGTGAAGSAPAPPTSLPPGAFILSFTNVMNTNEQVYAYCTGKDIATDKLAWLSAKGNSFYHPETTLTTPVDVDQAAVAIPLGPRGSTIQVTIPGYLNSARVYLSVGPMKQAFVKTSTGEYGQVQSDVGNPADPNAAINWGFMEFNWEQSGGLFADISAVDHIGLPLGISLETTDGAPPQRALGLTSTSVADVCTALQSQAKLDSQPWDKLCVYANAYGTDLVRVVAPQHYVPSSTNGTSPFAGYFEPYVNKIWSTYSSQPLTFDLSKQGYGKISCEVDPSSGDSLKCGNEPPFPKPSDLDIFGCASGPFAIPENASGCYKSIVPMLCAGIQRGTMLTPPLAAAAAAAAGGDAAGVSGAVQPSLPVAEYYKGNGPFNWYSKIAHQHEWEGKGYAFPYDDVDSMSGEAVAGTAMTSATTVEQLRVIVGGYDRMKLYGL